MAMVCLSSMPVIHCLPLTMDGMFETYARIRLLEATASHGLVGSGGVLVRIVIGTG